jgi:four helix bundle protein
MYRFQYLKVWNQSFSLTKEIILLSEKFPNRFKYSITEQLVRASLSVTNNIAEGSGRYSNKEERYFYSVARGSILEVVNMLLLVVELQLIERAEVKQLLERSEEVSKMLFALIKRNS